MLITESYIKKIIQEELQILMNEEMLEEGPRELFNAFRRKLAVGLVGLAMASGFNKYLDSTHQNLDQAVDNFVNQKKPELERTNEILQALGQPPVDVNNPNQLFIATAPTDVLMRTAEQKVPQSDVFHVAQRLEELGKKFDNSAVVRGVMVILARENNIN